MTLAPRRPALACLFLGVAALASGDQATVEYTGGLLSVRCADTPLAQVLDQIKAATGMALIVEGPTGPTRLTAEVSAQPMSLALPRLFEGTGVDYLLVADRADPRRIATLYVGDRKVGAAASVAGSVAPRPLARPRAVEPEPMAIPEALSEVESPAEEGKDDEISTDVEHVKTPAGVAPPPVAAPAPGFHPVLYPFGRPIPVQTPEERAARGRRRGVHGRQQPQD
jgi:hypothetical protein